MKKYVLSSILLSTMLMFSAVSGAADYKDSKEPVNATMGGASAQGMFAVAGEAINEMVRREYPGSSITYAPGSTAGSLALMLSGQVPLATAHSSIDIVAALEGTEPFQQAFPRESINLMARITNGMHPYAIARRDFVEKTGVKTFGDLFRNKVPMRISLNQKGTLPVYHQALALMEHYGVDEEAAEAWGAELFYVPTGQGTDMLKDRKLDVIFLVTFTPAGNVTQLVERENMVILPMERDAVEHVAKTFDLEVDVIEGNTYKGQAEDMPVTSLPIFLSAGPSADDATVYSVTRALIEHFDYFKSVHPLFKTFDKQMLIQTRPYSLHPAAVEAYIDGGFDPEELKF